MKHEQNNQTQLAKMSFLCSSTPPGCLPDFAEKKYVGAFPLSTLEGNFTRPSLYACVYRQTAL